MIPGFRPLRRQAGSAILGISNRMEVDDMKLAVIDGQGGRIGAQLVAAIRQAGLPGEVLAIGTNSAATAAMMKAGADAGATGENPVIVACRDADVIIGPIGILSADALLGEITPAMAAAVGRSRAVKLLLPLNQCNTIVVGTRALPVSALIAETLGELEKLTGKS